MRTAHLLTDEQRLRFIGTEATALRRTLAAGPQTTRGAQRALRNDLQGIGEAVHHLSADLKARHPAVPWREIEGLRNHLAHDHPVIDQATVTLAARTVAPALEGVAKVELARRAGHRSGVGVDGPARRRERRRSDLDLGL